MVLNAKSRETVCRTITRVWPSIWEEDPDAYEPKIVSIGPFHHGRHRLQSMETQKIRYVRHLLSRCGENSSENPPTCMKGKNSQDSDDASFRQKASEQLLHEFVKVVRELEPRVRKQYSEEIEFNADALVEMIVTDGCFIIEFLIKHRLGHIDGELVDKWSLLRNDLLLIENQVPFFVLESLFTKLVIYCPLNFTLMELAVHYLNPSYGFGPLPQVYHLLHLSHSMILTAAPDHKEEPFFHLHMLLLLCFSAAVALALAMIPGLEIEAPSFFSKEIVVPSSVFGLLVGANFLAYLVILLFSYFNKSTVYWRKIPCAVDLQEAAISLNKNVDDSSVKVPFEDGTMEISPLLAGKATNSEFLNLIAFEQCCESAVGNRFVRHVVFLHNVIKTARYVGLLIRDGDIQSKLVIKKSPSLLFHGLGRVANLRDEEDLEESTAAAPSLTRWL